MNDRELLELAAKAAGYFYIEDNGSWFDAAHMPIGDFDPLHDDGYAFRLAVALELDVVFYPGFGEVCVTNYDGSSEASEYMGTDKLAAARLAIVRAAAEIGSEMP
jgi:hypothetical protein